MQIKMAILKEEAADLLQVKEVQTYGGI